MTDYEIALLEKLDTIINGLNNLSYGVHFLMMIAAAFLLWQVIKILWGLLAGWFLGGL